MTKANSAPNPHEEVNKMGANSTPNSGDFEFIKAEDVSFVKRGRKSTADAGLISALKTLPKGGAIAIKKMKLDPNAENYKTEKARISSQIRSACRAANLSDFAIRFSPDGVPQVVR
jgi:hypothetical protein